MDAQQKKTHCVASRTESGIELQIWTESGKQKTALNWKWDFRTESGIEFQIYRTESGKKGQSWTESGKNPIINYLIIIIRVR